MSRIKGRGHAWDHWKAVVYDADAELNPYRGALLLRAAIEVLGKEGER